MFVLYLIPIFLDFKNNDNKIYIVLYCCNFSILSFSAMSKYLYVSETLKYIPRVLDNDDNIQSFFEDDMADTNITYQKFYNNM